MAEDDDGFEALVEHDDPDLLATQWWRRSMTPRRAGVDRRTALMALAGLSAAAGTMGTLSLAGCSSEVPVPLGIPEGAYELQRAHGWSLGAETLELAWPGAEVGMPVPPERLDTLPEALAPQSEQNQPFYGPVLFQSVAETAPATGPGRPLRELIRPMDAKSMRSAFGQGAGLSNLLEEAPEGVAVIVDLPGPDSVAFAAALANRLDPVFYFDNWPHPTGVVPAHMTLAAALHHFDTFQEMKTARALDAAPAFILDANRLLPYEDAVAFDNRYLSVLPSAERMAANKIQRVLYVRPLATDHELDDLNELMVSYRDAGIDVQLLAAERFMEDVSGDQPQPVTEESGKEEPAKEEGHYHTSHRHDRHHHYGGSYGTHWFFFAHYGWGGARYGARSPRFNAPTYRPARRSTQFDGANRSKDFGKVYVDKSGGKTAVSRHQPHATTSRSRPSGGSSTSPSGGRSSWGRSGGGASSS